MAGVGVLVYDGDCGFCTRSAQWALRRSRGMTAVPWQTADLASLGLTETQCQSAVQFVRGGGQASGGRAVALALQHCRQPYRSIGRVLGLSALAPLVEAGYWVVARNRHRLPGSTAACASDGDERPFGGTLGQGAGPSIAPADR